MTEVEHTGLRALRVPNGKHGIFLGLFEKRGGAMHVAVILDITGPTEMKPVDQVGSLEAYCKPMDLPTLRRNEIPKLNIKTS